MNKRHFIATFSGFSVGVGLIFLYQLLFPGSVEFSSAAGVSLTLSALIGGTLGGLVGFFMAYIFGIRHESIELLETLKMEKAAHLDDVAEMKDLIQKEADERQEVERELRQAQKMEAIGTLAGGVAHDMNNILGAIMTLSSTIKMGMKASGEGAQWIGDVREIMHACERGRDLTRALLEFSRKGKFIQGVMSLNRTVKELVKLLLRTAPKSVVLNTQLDPQLPQVEGDQGQISNVLMNLCINAIDAMDAKGTLGISTEPIEFSAMTFGLPAGKYCLLRVGDTGVGMDEEVARRAFEPFFTSRQKGQGTGLGLSTAYGIIKEHRGTIVIDSKPGRGTTMSVYLPALDSIEQDMEVERDSIASEPVAVSKTILLVDDEFLMRKAGAKLLGMLGYETMLAGDGNEALEIYKERHSEISLVMLDMIMPTMDGEETFKRMQEINPDVRVLLCSGYCPDDVAGELLNAGARGFIEKPFSPKTLMAKLLEVLEGSPGDASLEP